MQISPHAERRRTQHGFTLFEMLVALVIGTMVSLAVAGMARTVSPTVRLNADARAVGADFTRAALEARRTGSPVTMTVSRDGYAIEALGLARRWDSETGAIWQGLTPPDAYRFEPGVLSGNAVGLILRRAGAEAEIQLGPISGRVDVRPS